MFYCGKVVFTVFKPPILNAWGSVSRAHRPLTTGNARRPFPSLSMLTHWGRVTYICVSKLTIIGSDNGLSPDRHPAIIWTNAVILLIRTLGTNFNEILGEIHSFSFSKMHFKMSSAKWRLFGLGLNELRGTTWSNNGRSAGNGSRFEHKGDFYVEITNIHGVKL